MITIDDILAAQTRLDGHVRITPMLTSPFLDKIAGRPVFVKAECLQHTGSFKFRGGWSAISALPKDVRAKGVIAFSSGNHAQGIANAARAHGIPSVIIMPSDAPVIKIENTRALGAEVILYDREKEDRDALGASISVERDLTLIKPFNEPMVIAGQGTAGLEIAQQADAFGITKADVLIPCGGGGLTSGIAIALADAAPGLRPRPVEPEGFDDVTRSLAAGEILGNERQTGSICDAILTNSPGDITFPLMQTHCGPGIVLPEEDCLRAMAHAFNRLKIVIEPGGAVALAAALFHSEGAKEPVIAVASGGNADADIFQKALAKYG
jgi:threonine dehydratase